MALLRAAELAKAFDANIDVLHVWEAPAFVAPEAMVGVSGGTQTLAELARDHADTAMKEFVAAAEQDGIKVGTTIVKQGDPARVIVDTADSGNYDLVALGTHGRTGLSHLLLGSVAEKVVRRSRRPVLSVREKAK